MAARASLYLHLRGAPGGPFVTAGMGTYSGGWLSYEAGFGIRRARRGVFLEVRFVHLENLPVSARLVPISLGYFF